MRFKEKRREDREGREGNVSTYLPSTSRVGICMVFLMGMCLLFDEMDKGGGVR